MQHRHTSVEVAGSVLAGANLPKLAGTYACTSDISSDCEYGTMAWIERYCPVTGVGWPLLSTQVMVLISAGSEAPLG